LKIRKTDFVAGARERADVTVVIDVFRAFSVACYLFAGGARRVLVAGPEATARRVAEGLVDALLIGEREGRALPGFDAGNSPSQLAELDLAGRDVVMTTHAGAQGLTAATAPSVFTGALVNAGATASAVRALQPGTVNLVRMGWKAEQTSEEDSLCAEYLEALLSGRAFDVSDIRQPLRASPCAERFFDPAQPWSPPEDFELCLQTDRFDFAIAAQRLDVDVMELRAPRR
jgi:2-phosphosulfolactate phosphatase